MNDLPIEQSSVSTAVPENSIQPEQSPVVPTNPLTPPIGTPSYTPPQPVKPNHSSIIIGILCSIIVLGIVAFIFMQYNANKQAILVPEPTPIPIPTLAPVYNLTQIASTSAFLSFENHVASLSAQINGFSLQDGALTPPNLDAEITFKAQ